MLQKKDRIKIGKPTNSKILTRPLSATINDLKQYSTSSATTQFCDMALSRTTVMFVAFEGLYKIC